MSDLNFKKLEQLKKRSNNLEYFTEEDLIERVSLKKNIKKDEVRDLYRVFKMYLKKELESNADGYIGFSIPFFGYFMRKNIVTKDLLSDNTTLKYKSAKKLLDLYMSKSYGFGIKIK